MFIDIQTVRRLRDDKGVETGGETISPVSMAVSQILAVEQIQNSGNALVLFATGNVMREYITTEPYGPFMARLRRVVEGLPNTAAPPAQKLG